MSRYLVRFTPMEPYFFGSERTLSFPGSETQYRNLYFVRGEDVPLQTTLLGALRFMLLQQNGRDPHNQSRLSDRERLLAGGSSFTPQTKEPQGFGLIKRLSPVFLTDEAGVHYVPVPMDHNLADTEKKIGKFMEYSPFRHYKAMQTLDGPKLFTEDYDLKKGVAAGFMSLADGTIRDDLFSGTLRVGINRGEQENGFFKKEYKRLKKGFSFAVYCDLDGPWEGMPGTVFLGQGRSVFRVEGKEKADNDPGIEEETAGFLRQRRLLSGKGEKYTLLYCLSDAFMLSEDESSGLYDGLLFAVTDTRDFRSMQTGEKNDRLIRYKKKVLYHLMKAGSVLIAENEEKARAWLDRYRHENAETVGFNIFAMTEIKCEEETK